jgi:predicted dehydrogenase
MLQETDNSRREFIKAMGLGGLGLVTLSSPWMSVFAENKTASKGASDKVRIAVIGTGSRGSYHLSFLKQMEETDNIQIVALCDNYEPHLKEAMKFTKGTAKGFSDYRKVLDLKDLDCVLIATPLHQHAHIAIDALKAGKHVFCEKTMARTLSECKLMYDTAKQTGKILQIGHQRCFKPTYIKAIEYIRSGKIGKVNQIRAYWHRNNDWRRPLPSPELERQINWRLYKEYSCGLMTELASHQIQVANWVLGKTPVSVMGTGSINYWKDGREVDDNVALIYSYSDGTKFVYDSMISNKFYGLEEQIMGDKGTLELETNKMYSENPPQPAGILQLVNDMEKGLFNTIPIAGPSWVPETASNYKGDFISLDDKIDVEGKLQLIGLVNSIRQNKPIPQLLEQGYHSAMWTLLGQQAIDEQKILTLPKEFSI